MKLATHPFLLGLIVCVALVRSAHADERQSETVPGIDAYIRLSDRFRLYGTANLAQSLSEDVTDGDVGLYLDVLSLKEILPGPVLDLDWAAHRHGRRLRAGEIRERDRARLRAGGCRRLDGLAARRRRQPMAGAEARVARTP